MERFSPYKKAPIEALKGGVSELTRDRIIWGCHGVVVWLTQANSSVGQRCIYCLLVFILKTYMYYIFIMYMYYKGTLVVSSFVLARRCLEKVFKPACNVLK